METTISRHSNILPTRFPCRSAAIRVCRTHAVTRAMSQINDTNSVSPLQILPERQPRYNCRNLRSAVYKNLCIAFLAASALAQHEPRPNEHRLPTFHETNSRTKTDFFLSPEHPPHIYSSSGIHVPGETHAIASTVPQLDDPNAKYPPEALPQLPSRYFHRNLRSIMQICKLYPSLKKALLFHSFAIPTVMSS